MTEPERSSALDEDWRGVGLAMAEETAKSHHAIRYETMGKMRAGDKGAVVREGPPFVDARFPPSRHGVEDHRSAVPSLVIEPLFPLRVEG